jgi:hypothetical protein
LKAGYSLSEINKIYKFALLSIFPFQLYQLPGLLGPHAAGLFSPSVAGLAADPRYPADLTHDFPLHKDIGTMWLISTSISHSLLRMYSAMNVFFTMLLATFSSWTPILSPDWAIFYGRILGGRSEMIIG